MYSLRTKATVKEGIISIHANEHVKRVVYEPGNGTRMDLTFVIMPTQETIPPRSMLIWEKFKSGVFHFSHHVHVSPWHIEENLNTTISDAVCIGELIAHLYPGVRAFSGEEFEKRYGKKDEEEE